MDDNQLSVEQLMSLSRAVPEDSERKELTSYLKVTASARIFVPHHHTRTGLP
jgi:biotin synthase-like enzyme